jgi:hypothetical protein
MLPRERSRCARVVRYRSKKIGGYCGHLNKRWRVVQLFTINSINIKFECFSIKLNNINIFLSPGIAKFFIYIALGERASIHAYVVLAESGHLLKIQLIQAVVSRCLAIYTPPALHLILLREAVRDSIVFLRNGAFVRHVRIQSLLPYFHHSADHPYCMLG